MNELDFLQNYYLNKLLLDFGKIEESVKEIPNKTLSESILSALKDNKYRDSGQSLEHLFDFDLDSQRYTGGTKEDLQKFLTLLPKVPWPVYEYLFADVCRGSMSAAIIHKTIRFHPEKFQVDEEVVEALSELEISIGCPSFFKAEYKLSCVAACSNCWLKTTEEFLKPIIEAQTPDI